MITRRGFITWLITLPFVGHVTSKWTTQYTHKAYSLGIWIPENVLDQEIEEQAEERMKKLKQSMQQTKIQAPIKMSGYYEDTTN